MTVSFHALITMLLRRLGLTYDLVLRTLLVVPLPFLWQANECHKHDGDQTKDYPSHPSWI
jgi:hypothetical protein